jgi:hypothetical protein
MILKFPREQNDLNISFFQGHHMLELQQHLNLKHLRPPDNMNATAANLLFNHMQVFQNGVQQQQVGIGREHFIECRL